jgi:hypothetical protein
MITSICHLGQKTFHAIEVVYHRLGITITDQIQMRIMAVSNAPCNRECVLFRGHHTNCRDEQNHIDYFRQLDTVKKPSLERSRICSGRTGQPCCDEQGACRHSLYCLRGVAARQTDGRTELDRLGDLRLRLQYGAQSRSRTPPPRATARRSLPPLKGLVGRLIFDGLAVSREWDDPAGVEAAEPRQGIDSLMGPVNRYGPPG